MTPQSLVQDAAGIALALLAGVVIVAAVRLIKGPHLADRVIALDLLAVLAICLIGCLAVQRDLPVLLDAALVIALLAFLSTVAVARYLEREP